MHEKAKCHPERDAYTHSSDFCGPCYRHDYYERNKAKWQGPAGYSARWRKQNPDKMHEFHRRWYYAKRAAQRSTLGPEVCAICGETKQRLYMDHDHKKFKTGKSGWRPGVKHRGLLCNRCNVGLGMVENADLLKKALAYLEARP